MASLSPLPPAGCLNGVQFRPMLAADAVLLELKPSQHRELGLDEPVFTFEKAADLADNGLAWTAHEGSRILCCSGFRQLYEGHAIAWAAFALDLGRAGIAITRFAKRQLAAAPFRRIEAIVEAGNDIAVEWATRIGLQPVHVLRRYGANDETHILFERVQ